MVDLQEIDRRLISLESEFKELKGSFTKLEKSILKKAKATFERELDSLKETIEILSDKELLKRIREGIMDIEEGRTFPLEKLKQKYDL